MPAWMASAGEWNDMRLAVDDDLAFVRLVQAVELPHQGALAGAVFAQQGMHFPGVHVEADVGVGQHAREALDDVAHLHVLDALTRDGVLDLSHASPEVSPLRKAQRDPS